MILSAQTSVYENNTEEIRDGCFNLPVPVINKENILPKNENNSGNKLVFFNELKLGMVSTDYKMGKTFNNVYFDHYRILLIIYCFQREKICGKPL